MRNAHRHVRRDTAPEVPPRSCDWPECDDMGQHRAPKSRDELQSYYWFCLLHVRAYNASWNYYAGMSDAEVEADIRRDTTWDRPSWPLGAARAARAHAGHGFDPDRLHDVFGLYGEHGPEAGARERRSRPETPPGPERTAMEVLDLKPPLTLAAVKRRYKTLVKIHHPDANNGDKASEERFKAITEAYRTLVESLSGAVRA